MISQAELPTGVQREKIKLSLTVEDAEGMCSPQDGSLPPSAPRDCSDRPACLLRPSPSVKVLFYVGL